MSEMAYERALRAWLEERDGRWETLRYARPDAGGEVCAYRLSPPLPPRGVVLAVHGAGNDALFAFVGLFRELLSRNLEVFTFDLDGHGRRSSTTLSTAALPGAVAAALEVARSGREALPVHGVGVSLGGSVLLRALADLPGAFASAALLVAPLRIEFSRRALINELGRPLVRLALRERDFYGWTGLIPSFGPLKRGSYPLRLAQPRPSAFGYVQALNDALASLRLEEAAAQVRAPVLLVYGAADRLVPPAQGERLHAQLQHSELRVLTGETHLTAPLAPAAIRRALEWMER